MRGPTRSPGGCATSGVGPESLVGICMLTGLTRLAAFFGIWKAGGGYVPLDSGLPPDRLSYMIADTGMTLILADAVCAAALPDSAAVVVRLDDGQLDDHGAAAGPPPEVGVTPANVAYVIYTSGSTGQPKGVMVEHRHAVNFHPQHNRAMADRAVRRGAAVLGLHVRRIDHGHLLCRSPAVPAWCSPTPRPCTRRVA